MARCQKSWGPAIFASGCISKVPPVHNTCDTLRQGILREFDAASGRWLVELPCGSVKAVRRKLTKMNNFKKVTALLKLCKLGVEKHVGKRSRSCQPTARWGGELFWDGPGPWAVLRSAWALVDSGFLRPYKIGPWTYRVFCFVPFIPLVRSGLQTLCKRHTSTVRRGCLAWMAASCLLALFCHHAWCFEACSPWEVRQPCRTLAGAAGKRRIGPRS